MSELEDRLYTVKCTPDTQSHLHPDQKCCLECRSKICTKICPADVYEWDEESKKLIVNFENCLECGACRIACESSSLDWEYPRGNKGLMYKRS